jgi:putative ATPase
VYLLADMIRLNHSFNKKETTMTDLFDDQYKENSFRDQPLAARMRPRTLDEYVGQKHIVGEGKLLRRAIEADRLFHSIILFGPPGTGKTTLARVIANHTSATFENLSAVLTGVKDLRRVISEAEERKKYNQARTVLFVDEVHRWNKAQQDGLLPHVESGLITLIGATTENPYFEVIPALVSRSRIFELKPLLLEDMGEIFDQAIKDEDRGYGYRKIEFTEEAREYLLDLADGDARNLLNALELSVETTLPDEDGVTRINIDIASESIQRRVLRYDKGGDSHYDTISAFIKSMRGSDPDAAVYWLMKMIDAGEDPRFIIRRLIVLAGEDIGLADPNALRMATSAAYAFDYIGLPEGLFPMIEATIYLATAPKSNSILRTMGNVQKWQKEHGIGRVPIHLMDGNRDAKGLGHGEGYLYPHEYPVHIVGQQYLPDEAMGESFYEPGDLGYEQRIQTNLERWRELRDQDWQRRKSMGEDGKNEKP